MGRGVETSKAPIVTEIEPGAAVEAANPRHSVAKASPTARTKQLLESQGWTVEIVEHWNPFARRRQDLFGFADLFAVKEGERPKLIQVTSLSNFATRRTKVAETPAAAVCVGAGIDVEIHGWEEPTKSTPARLRREVLRAAHPQLIL